MWFLSLDAANILAVKTVRKYFCLPYYHARMQCDLQQHDVHYYSKRIHANAPSAEFAARYWPVGSAQKAEQGSLEYWLTERYCLYTKNKWGDVCRAEIHHAPWPLQRAKAEIEVNSMADACDITLPSIAPLLHFSKFQDVAVWPLRKV